MLSGQPNPQALSNSFSAYLDLLRFTAALAVVLAHMKMDQLDVGWIPLSEFSHEAVVVFFVLSGFIICHTTQTKRSNGIEYAVARLSRIYSVALPAVALCVLLAVVLESLPGYNTAQLSNWVALSSFDIVSSLLFLNESWNNPALLTLNNPYWSLCYEVWFYIIFGCWWYLNGPLRLLAVGLAAAVAGPAIIALLPIWLMGAYLAHSRLFERQWNPILAALVFAGTAVLVLLIKHWGLSDMVRSWMKQYIPGWWRFESSQMVVTDLLIGLLITLNLAVWQSLPKRLTGLVEAARPTLMGLAGFSFSLYLFHRPLTQILGAHFPIQQSEKITGILAMVAIVVSCWLMSLATEKKLAVWRTYFRKLLSFKSA